MFGIPLTQRRQRVYEVAAEQSHWTVADMDRLPDDEWFRYELIDGKLIISEAGHWDHQRVVGSICYALDTWIRSDGLGAVPWRHHGSSAHAVSGGSVWISRPDRVRQGCG